SLVRHPSCTSPLCPSCNPPASTRCAVAFELQPLNDHDAHVGDRAAPLRVGPEPGVASLPLPRPPDTRALGRPCDPAPVLVVCTRRSRLSADSLRLLLST